MADPRTTPPMARSANYSPLVTAQIKCQQAGKQSPNFCPFGCQDWMLDQNGYCVHLIGFTNDGVNYEPMKRRRGDKRLCVYVERESIQVGIDEQGPIFKEGPPKLLPVLADDRLERVTTSYRVYRNVETTGGPPATSEPNGPPVRLVKRGA